MSKPDKDKKHLGRVLIVAGSDSGGGAGVQADIKTVTMLGGYAATAITALTVQNTQGVSGVIPAPPQGVAAQMRAVLSDIGADTIKTGMLGDKVLIETVAKTIHDTAPNTPRIIDPVMVATSGDMLIPRAAADSILSLLVPGSIVTPNAHEAEVLTGKDVQSLDGQRRAAEKLLEKGAAAAIIKGGHVEGDAIVDLVATPAKEMFFEQERIQSTSTHGTGCTLASALACSLAQGLDLEKAFKRAQAYVAKAIRHAPGFGNGNGPLDHAWPVRFPDKAARLLAPLAKDE